MDFIYLTYSGHFHADEALAVYLLRLLPSYASSPLVRTRDPSVLATCHTVVDVGSEYDPARNRYDHHQREFSVTFPNHSTRLSSAGLIFMHFGRTLIAQQASLPVDHPNVTVVYEKLYTDFIEAIDANDNGIANYDSAALAAANVESRFKQFGITLPSMVGDLNYPDATAGPDDPQDEDSLFAKASKLMGTAFVRKLSIACSLWLPSRDTVVSAYEQRREEVHPSGRIVMFPQGGLPWKEHLYTIEKEEPGEEGLVYYVLYPEALTEGSKWRVQCVPVSDGSFESRKPLPVAWRGVRDDNLDAVIADEAEKMGKNGIPQGAVFVHASGFIGGHKTKEGALAMAVRSLSGS